MEENGKSLDSIARCLGFSRVSLPGSEQEEVAIQAFAFDWRKKDINYQLSRSRPLPARPWLSRGLVS